MDAIGALRLPENGVHIVVRVIYWFGLRVPSGLYFGWSWRLLTVIISPNQSWHATRTLVFTFTVI
jgi:hypothetical protein